MYNSICCTCDKLFELASAKQAIDPVRHIKPGRQDGISDWCYCPHCDSRNYFPLARERFLSYMRKEGKCVLPTTKNHVFRISAFDNSGKCVDSEVDLGNKATAEKAALPLTALFPRVEIREYKVVPAKLQLLNSTVMRG